MPTVTLTKWGNSIGIRIPSAIIKEAHLHLGEELEIRADEKGVLTLIPIKNQQEGWLEQFNAAVDDSSEDTAHLNPGNEFDMEEWTW
ncbi:AbrB/MazE/SpoVT family DNA-binding domain-containing protein [Legionella sp. 16cNR16C]|uniref:AbrB/MazE/SpoVT family DNA-binding domain-containing protein n=1 Tax=Legionella sp. 16cNR16C TaxID=2905656 RepID=UPI001E2EE47F|nr:AbrB/MazE/SpoVT family DNA-binding domain-containing protein [Legionella sp. 16cNR16C]MCE3044446.1 AbrB/MazE/SpoVT family DNA-binding domain-containing protein [Legionella sp. 16cNR16C]